MAKLRTPSFILLGLFFLFFALSAFIKNKINQKIESGFANLEGANYDSYEISLWQGKITISDIDLNTKMVQINDALNGNKVVGSIDEAYINGLHWWDLLRNKRLLASEITLKTPLLKIIKIPADSISISQTSDTKSTQAFFAQIKSINLQNGNIAFFDGEKVENPKMSIGSIFLSFKDFTFDDALTNNKMAIVDYDLSVEDFYLQAGDKLHDLNLEKVRTDGKNLQLHNFTFKSPFETDAFFQKLEYRKSKLDIDIPEIILHDFALEKAFQNEFSLALLEINALDMTVFADKNIPPKANLRKALPTEKLRQLETLLSIDSISVKDAKITYSLKQEDKQERGEVFWTNINASFENITNDSLKIYKNQDLTAKVNSKFMGNSNFDLTVRFLLDSPLFAYDVYGKLDTFDMRQTNQMFEDITSIRVESGNVQELTFNFHADDNKSIGNLDFYYKNLQVRLERKKGKRARKFLKWIVEKVIIKKENAADEGNKKGEIDTIRNTEKGFFNQLWNSVLDGLKDVILPG